jgi:hypothetical protein
MIHAMIVLKSQYHRFINLWLILLLIHSKTLHAQHFDFDSLYQNNEWYKQFITSHYDTLDVFRTEETMKITIESDFKNLVKKKYRDEYQPAYLKYLISDSVMLTRQIKIKPRGNIRRRVCYFPPLKLNFPKKKAVSHRIREFDKMKMVVKCSKSKINEQYLLSEYYAYKLFNILSKYSFRVKLLEVTYVDIGGKYKSGTSYAYLIESIEQLAERLGAIPLESRTIPDESTERHHLAMVYLFQYLIGNTDWSIPANHNIKLIKTNDPDVIVPYVIPYDFDYAGIVNTNYAAPDASLGIKSVRERVYRGKCIGDEILKEVAGEFIKVKEEVYTLYDTAPELEKATRQNTIQYLDEFYSIIENEGRFRIQILGNCR